MSKIKKQKKLLKVKKKITGRNFSGKITIRSRGGGQKRFLRLIDWKRTTRDIPARIASIEYDPNRSADIALLSYSNGHKAYILAPHGIKIGDTVIASDKTEIRSGNACMLKNIPVGTPIHCLEIFPGKGAQMVRGAGNFCMIQSKEEGEVIIKLPSGEVRVFKDNCLATIGSLSNPEHKDRNLGKAGVSRHLGRRPTVRGVAQHPGSHPHGGGEGRSGIGMKSPKSPWGKKTLGKKTRKKKYSDKLIIKSRKAKR